MTAREVGQLSLQERLELTGLICRRQPERGRRVAAAWLQRWIAETPGTTIDDAALTASLLTALGGHLHDSALGALVEMLNERVR